MKKLLPLLILCLLMTACQKETLPTTVGKPTGSESPSQTAASTQAATTAPTEKPFQIADIQNGMTREEVQAVIGTDGQLLHSDVFVHKWKIRDWKTVYIWFYAPNPINTEDLWTAGNDWLCGGMQIVDDCMAFPGDRKLTLADTQKIHEGMPLKEVIDIFGYGAESVGSGFTVLQWPMEDGRFLLVHFIGTVSEISIAEESSSRGSYVGNVNRIHEGMTFQQVREILTGTNALACKHADIYQYTLKDGRILLVWYCEDSGVMKACHAEFK